VLNAVENVFAKLGYYLFVLGMLTVIGNIIQIVEVPILLPMIIVVGSILLIALSFGAFQWQIWPQISKRKMLWGAILLPFLLYVPLNLVLFSTGIVELHLHDFGAYYNAAVRFLNGAPLYQTTQEIPTLQAQFHGELPYLYPPIFVLLFVPLVVFPPVTAALIWNIVVLLFLVWSVSKLVSTFDTNFNRRERFLLYVVIVSFAPTISWVKLGQVSGLLTGFLCLSGAKLRSNQHGLSGMFTTLGGIVKPFYAPSGAHLLRHRRRFLTAVITGIGVIIVGLLVFGVDTHIEYIGVLREGKGWETGAGPSSWNTTQFNPFYILGPLKHIPRVIIVLGTAGLALYSNKTEVPIEYIFALGVSVVPFAGPTTNTLALNAVIPAILMVGFYELEKGEEFPKPLVLSALLIHIHPYTVEFLSNFSPRIYPPIEAIAPVIPLLQPALYGMALLVGYLTYRSWKNPIG